MELEHRCSGCAHRFSVPSGSGAAALLDQMAAEGPWCALGDGETFEDQLFHALGTGDAVHCPQCGERALVTEESLSEFERELLTQW